MRKCQYFDDIARAARRLQKLLIEGKVEGTRKRGRLRNSWIGKVRELMGLVENAVEWKKTGICRRIAADVPRAAATSRRGDYVDALASLTVPGFEEQ